MLIILCGKSASGKDTLARELNKQGYESIVSTTTRPMREGEEEGREYFFTDKKTFLSHLDSLIEYRQYETKVQGKKDTWYYGTEKRGLNENKNYVAIKDLVGAKALKEYYQEQGITVKTLYLDVPDEIRTQRAERRLGFDKTEWDRRLINDCFDFTDELIDEVCDKRISNLSVKELLFLATRNDAEKENMGKYTIRSTDPKKIIRRIIFEENNTVYNFTESVSKRGVRDTEITIWDKKDESRLDTYSFSEELGEYEAVFRKNVTLEDVKDFAESLIEKEKNSYDSVTYEANEERMEDER